MSDMKIIEWISDHIEEEINDAHTYIEKALMTKKDYPRLAETLSKLSDEEMRHMTMLHNEVVNIIEEYKAKHGEPPKEMMIIYEYLHKKQIDRSAEVKGLQAMYKN